MVQTATKAFVFT